MSSLSSGPLKYYDIQKLFRYESQDAEYIRQYGKIPNAD